MQISVCILTRDAEEKIELALRSVADLDAEVIVGDTGSSDDTRGVAQAAGARVVDIDWHDDFGAAQNQVVAAATWPWILWLNPDEELLQQGRAELPALLVRPKMLAYVVRVQEILRADRPELALEMGYPRLFQRHPGLKFVGRLHPHFDPPLEEVARREGLEIRGCELLVRHHAYTSVLTERKLRWATRLLELELRDRPGQIHYLVEYGRHLLRLNDSRGHEVLAEAAEQVLAAEDAPQAPAPTVASLLEYALTVAPAQLKGRLTAAKARQLAQRWFPRSPPLLWAMAQTAYQAGEHRRAAELLETMIDLARDGGYDSVPAFDPAIMGEPALLNLGKCYAQLGELDRAESCFAPLLSSPTHQAEARQGYAAVQELRRRQR